ncbi:unnamed protein product, partial [Caenorhabditis auriculariae]
MGDKDELVAQAVENDANYEQRIQLIRSNDYIDAKFGFDRYTSTVERKGFLMNLQPAEMIDEQTKQIVSVVDFYFISDMDERFKISYPFRPYMYIATLEGSEHQVQSFLCKKYGNMVTVEYYEKEDLDMKNHLAGLKKPYIKLSFASTVEMSKMKKDLMPLIRKNKERIKKESQYVTYLANNLSGKEADRRDDDVLGDIVDIREYDVPYHMRVSIDEKIFVGLWYDVRGIGPMRVPTIKKKDLANFHAKPKILAFDIETTKLPLKFPDRESDEIMMISYMVDGQGFLIINREIVSADISPFEYAPKPEYKGEFVVWNEVFLIIFLKVRPNIVVTYNGDSFDWPFVEARAKIRGFDMEKEIGFSKDSADEYKSRNCIHMDAYRWVKRDSYLPVGSQNLKAVTKAKLRYDPVEVEPELMCKMARELPQHLANYSVSDAVSTYYLYMKYVHPFIFALCTIIPLGADDVLRKGSGTLCEALLMVEAFHNNIVFPNKFTGAEEAQMTNDGHRIESETYVGGHVEALEAGVFRADIPCRFRLIPSALSQLKDEVPETLKKELIREFGVQLEQVVDFEERCNDLRSMFDTLIETPSRSENPRIYHLDVGAMYPNIILTNRLEPCAMVNEEICMGCSYNRPDAQCKRTMAWEWRGELIPASRGEYQQIIQQLEGESFGKPPKPFHMLDRQERHAIEIKRVKDYSRRVYGKTHMTRLEMRNTTICQRENHFYVETVKAFRDRRYEYKELLKKSKASLDQAIAANDLTTMTTAKLEMVLYESLQLAHKCILNSFYGYVMRKGSRWFSMEMAGIVCHTGANIIREARKLVEQIGKPLELDTDGIWCLIPSSFPENITFQLQNHKRKSVTVSYPGAMLNALVYEGFTNHQYHTLQKDGSYSTSSENSIYFEVDGPYQCMVLPASKEEGKKLKKRYAVFNLDGSLAELKGFELKRRGELNIIKHFQSSVFQTFLGGKSLEEVYKCVSGDANYWLDILYSKGEELSDEELFDLISENRSMSRKLEDYGAQKSTSISTAKRLAEFLGAEMVKDAGLACMFVISKYPMGSPVTERAIPVAIFKSEPKVQAFYLRKWTKLTSLTEDTDIRDLLDWDYYLERLGSCIQKIITIPAALQGVTNPVPRVAHPDWLANKLRNKFDAIRQPRISDLFARCAKTSTAEFAESGKRLRTDDHDSDDVIVEVDESNKENDIENLPKRHRIEEDAKKKKNTIEPETLERKTLAAHGFDEWLGFLKKKWTIQKKKRKEELINRGANIVDEVMNSAREAENERTWQILSIEPTRETSFFNLWVSVNGQMNKFPLKIQRSILVDCKEQREGREVVRRILPHHKLSHFLYEYRADENQMNSLMDKLYAERCCASIVGIYESNVPALFRCLVNLGCVVLPIAPPTNSTYGIDSFKPISLSVERVSYLSETPRIVFLYKFSQDSRHVWSLVDPNTRTASFFVVNRGQLQMPNMDIMYTQAYKKMKEMEKMESCTAEDNIKFNTKQFNSATECNRELGRVLRTAREASSKTTLLILLTDAEPRQLMREVPNVSLFPHVRLHIREPSSLLNVIDWQRVVAKRVIQHFFNSYIFLTDFLEWARYLRIPIGNVPSDLNVFALDLFFARHLKRNGHALWASPTSRPDLGGKELDDMRLAVEWTPLSVDDTVLLNREVFCATACVEVQLSAVAVTALVQRSRVLEAEGAEDAVAFDTAALLPFQSIFGVQNSISSYDEGAAVDGSLKILKQMLTECVRDIAHHNNPRADDIVMSVGRWLHTSGALLYDPALTRSVGILEKKLVLLLCAECERMGAKVVHATSQKLVLNTGKATQNEAKAFAQMLIGSLSTNVLFAALQITPRRYYEALLWMDAYNHTGIGQLEENEVLETAILPDALGRITQSHWRIADELPPEGDVRQEFEKIITGFVMIFLEKRKEMAPNEFDAETYRNIIIEKEIAHRVFRIIAKLTHQSAACAISAAAFVNTICRALAADSACEVAVDSLKENAQRLLDNVKIDESQKSQFKTIFLSNLYCHNCSQSSNVHLSDDAIWNCATCGHRLSVDTVDNMICERLSCLLTAYQLQDHVCLKCKAVRRDNLSLYCECSGDFSNVIDPQSLATEAKTAAAIAKSRDLRRTAELAAWISTANDACFSCCWLSPHRLLHAFAFMKKRAGARDMNSGAGVSTINRAVPLTATTTVTAQLRNNSKTKNRRAVSCEEILPFAVVTMR